MSLTAKERDLQRRAVDRDRVREVADVEEALEFWTKALKFFSKAQKKYESKLKEEGPMRTKRKKDWRRHQASMASGKQRALSAIARLRNTPLKVVPPPSQEKEDTTWTPRTRAENLISAGHSDEYVSKALGVSESFVSLVRRELGL